MSDVLGLGNRNYPLSAMKNMTLITEIVLLPSSLLAFQNFSPLIKYIYTMVNGGKNYLNGQVYPIS